MAQVTLDELESEAEAIVSRDIPIGWQFLMDKTELIREDCHILLAGEDGSTKAG